MRRNSLTMQQRCAAENINYWPIPIEGDGQTSKSFDSFLNKVSDYVSTEGHNSQCFKRFWTTNLEKTRKWDQKTAKIKEMGSFGINVFHPSVEENPVVPQAFGIKIGMFLGSPKQQVFGIIALSFWDQKPKFLESSS